MVTFRNACILMMSSLGMVAAVGCAERHNAIPSSARLVAEDTASRSDFVAPSDGDVYVEDKSANKLLYSGKINEGERLQVDPLKDRLTINGQTVRDQKIRDLNNVRIFFRPEPGAEAAGSRTVVVPVQPVQPAQPARSGESEIIVQPRSSDDADRIRVKSGTNDSKVTVEPGDDGSKVTIEPK
jgi:hypothetical protein